MNCERCGGTGEIPLLGPNTTSCPDCEDNNQSTWKEMLWAPEERSGTIIFPSGTLFADEPKQFRFENRPENYIQLHLRKGRWRYEGVDGVATGKIAGKDQLIKILDKSPYVHFQPELSEQ